MHTQHLMTVDLDWHRLQDDLNRAKKFSLSDAYSEFICGEWRSCMLCNKSGNVDDNFLQDYDRPAQMTAFGKQMPYLVEVLQNTFRLSLLRFARLAKLTPGSVLIPHRDYIELKRDLIRIHIPLDTDSKCFSAEEDTIYQMREGEVWFIDATEAHSAANFSNKPRTHLILDFTEVDQLDAVFSIPVNGSQLIPSQNIVSRATLGVGEKEGILALAKIIDLVNYKDVFAVLIKKYFTADLRLCKIFEWLLEIARLSGKSDVLAQVCRHLDHCLIQR